MDHRLAGVLTAVAALAALGVAYFAQYVLRLTPCELCLLERWPYRIVIVLGLLGTLARPRTTRIILGMAGLVMLADVLIAGLHVGVEFNWWPSPLPECNGELIPGAALPMTPATPCDRPVDLIHGLPISMAQMDFCAAVLFSILLLTYAAQKKTRRFR
ncbi:disulfide bond formation protein B [Acidocella sp.]|uniref:disulfide bond formation protein B n=1 Tax=Acidocella sp. TaxID=50710 RepID=UPI00262804D3|nr:disulfide bond formation protein B [Acidocella sp.]